LSRKLPRGPRAFNSGVAPLPEGARTGPDGMYGSLFDLVDTERLRSGASPRKTELEQVERRRGRVNP
jgi:hypothetical protein